MPSTGVDAFDTTLHKTNTWLKELMEELGWSDRHKAFIALRAVLHALRDRLLPQEAAEFGAQLPMLVRGFYYEGWSPSGKPIKYDREDFLIHIVRHFPNDVNLDPEKVARAVFTVISRRIDQGEIKDIKAVLPKHIRELWEGLPTRSA